MRLRQPIHHALAMLFALAVCAFARNGSADEVDAMLRDIAKARVNLKTLSSTFTQERTIGLLASTVHSEGELTLVSPDRLRWELKAPDSITYWISPEGVAFASARGGAAATRGTTGRFGAVLADLLIFLGGDLASLKPRYEFSVPSRKDGIVLIARPKAPDLKKQVLQIEVAAGAALWDIKSIMIEETEGDRSVITFGKPLRDAPVDMTRMKPPAK